MKQFGMLIFGEMRMMIYARNLNLKVFNRGSGPQIYMENSEANIEQPTRYEKALSTP